MPATIRALPARSENSLFGTTVWTPLLRAISRKKGAEAGRHKAKAHERNAGSEPGQKRAFGRQVNARIRGSFPWLVHKAAAAFQPC